MSRRRSTTPTQKPALLLAEPVKRFAALDTQLRLERAGLVIEPGVHDAAVVRALMGGDAIFRLENYECSLRHSGHRGRQTNDPAADDGRVIPLQAWRVPL